VADHEHLPLVGDVVEALREAGFDPVLVGGMALVILGSLRVTRDFDFLIAHPAERLGRVVGLFYDRGFQLVARLSETGDVTATIESRRVAALRLRIDRPASAYFYNMDRRLRIDLLFDFPLPAAEIAKNAKATKVLSQIFDVASPEDLLRLKTLAHSARSFAGDAQDVEFLNQLLKA
jgi:hypothetical protein